MENKKIAPSASTLKAEAVNAKFPKNNELKVVLFTPNVATSSEELLFNEYFRKSKEQEHIVMKIANDLGGLFNLFSLPHIRAVELIGIGTFSLLAGNAFAKKCYAEKLVESLEYLEPME